MTDPATHPRGFAPGVPHASQTLGKRWNLALPCEKCQDAGPIPPVLYRQDLPPPDDPGPSQDRANSASSERRRARGSPTTVV
jgi:hypothetical protein